MYGRNEDEARGMDGLGGFLEWLDWYFLEKIGEWEKVCSRRSRRWCFIWGLADTAKLSQ
jgi:hypothetical protein